MSIQRKLQILSLVGMLALLGMAAAALTRIGDMNDALLHTSDLSQAVREDLACDVIHDDLREDVDAALAAASQAETAAAAERAELHADAFAATCAATRQDSLDADSARIFASMLPDIDRYIRDSRRIVKLAATDRDAARAALASYVALYDRLGAQMTQLSDALATSIQKSAQASSETVATSRIIVWALLGTGVLVMAIVGVMVSRPIVRALAACSRTATAVGGGDLTASADVRNRDETGALASGLDAAVRSVRESLSSVKREAGEVGKVASELTSVSTTLAAGSARVSSEVADVAASTAAVSDDIQTLATGLDQMRVAAAEVAANASRTSTVASEAVRLSEAASSNMRALQTTSLNIGAVVKSVADIAAKTNLLALNASIEATRAGEVGRGFAVVAAEVKDLARQSTGAMEQIARDIEKVQAEVTQAAGALDVISGTIHAVNERQASTASAVEEQHATLGSLAIAVQRVSRASESIARAVSGVASSADEGAAGARHVEGAAARLSGLVGEVNARLSRFRLA